MQYNTAWSVGSSTELGCLNIFFPLFPVRACSTLKRFLGAELSANENKFIFCYLFIVDSIVKIYSYKSSNGKSSLSITMGTHVKLIYIMFRVQRELVLYRYSISSQIVHFH